MKRKFFGMKVVILMALLLALVVVGPVGADPMEVIAKDVLTSGEKAYHDFSIKTAKITNSDFKKAEVNSNGHKKISVSVEATPRASGGITVELFCEDNTGRFMPVWGGSITTAISDWNFTSQDIKREDINGCYFAVVDSTAEAGL